MIRKVIKKRPLTVVILICLLIATGAIGLAYNLSDFKISKPFESELV